MKTHATLLTTILATAATTAAHAAVAHLDLSSQMTYDAVGTQVEMDRLAAIPADQLPEANKRTLTHTIGEHAMINNGGNNGRAYYSGNQGDGGLPAGLTPTIGDRTYQFAAFDNGAGDAPAHNAVLLNARNNSVTKTWTLETAQQQAYDDINFLFVASRSNTAGSYQARITATYTDGSSADVFDTGLVAAGSSIPGGSFGSGGVAAQGGLYQASDSDTAVTRAIAMTTYIDHTGSWSTSPNSRVNDEAVSSLWSFTTPLDLDESKTLESITFYTSSNSVGRNVIYVFAASATPIPEPATLALLTLGALLITRRSPLKSKI